MYMCWSHLNHISPPPCWPINLSHTLPLLANLTPMHDPWLFWTNPELTYQSDIHTWPPPSYRSCVWPNWDERGLQIEWVPHLRMGKSVLNDNRDHWAPSRSQGESLLVGHLICWWCTGPPIKSGCTPQKVGPLENHQTVSEYDIQQELLRWTGVILHTLSF